jgi:hypothetical protein
MLAVSLVVLLSFAALAVDISWLRFAQFQAQNAADAGAHAALVELRSTFSESAARTRASQLVVANAVAGEAAAADPSVDITFGIWDFDLAETNPEMAYTEGGDPFNAVSVTVRREEGGPGAGPVRFFIAPILGEEFGSANAAANAVGALRPRDMVVVMDITGSMSYNSTSTQTKMEAAQEAAVALLDELDSFQIFGDRVGMVTFVAGAEEWSPLTEINDEGEFATLRSQWADDLDWCNRSYLSSGSYAYHNAPQMLNCSTVDVGEPATHPSDAGTKQASGIELALDILAADGNDNAVPTIILVSDGLPQCVPQTSSCDGGRAEAGREARDRAEEEGVLMFSVNINNATPVQAQVDYMCELTNPPYEGSGDCEAGNDLFFDYVPGSGASLTDIFLEIARNIPVALVQ